MILNEPPPTPYDLRFHLGPVPVRIHPLFWLIAVFMGISGKNPDGILLVLWVITVFVSILVHEMGHIVAMRQYGENGHIVLHGFGGLAISNGFSRWGRGRTPAAQIVISLAGPCAGFLLASICLLGFKVSGGDFNISFGRPLLINLQDVVSPPDTSPYLTILFLNFWFVNLFWGLLNLVPIYPLDGGQIARAVFQLWEPHRGIIQSLWLSVYTAGVLAVVAFVYWKATFLGFFFVYFAVTNYMTIQQLHGSGFGRGPRW